MTSVRQAHLGCFAGQGPLAHGTARVELDIDDKEALNGSK